MYGIDTWGEAHAAIYVAALDRAIDELGDLPEIGPTRDDLRPGLRSRLVGEHIVFYRVTQREIRVSRILHARQDPFAAAEI